MKWGKHDTTGNYRDRDEGNNICNSGIYKVVALRKDKN